MGTVKIVLSILFTFLALVYNCIRRRENYWNKKGIKCINPNSRFMFANVPYLRKKSIPEFTIDLYNQFPDEKYFVFYQLTQPIFVIKDPEIIKEIKATNFDSLIDCKPLVAYFWRKNTFVSRYLRGRKQRHQLNPFFTENKVKTMIDLMKDCAQNFLNHLDSQVHDSFIIEAKDFSSRYINDVIASTSFGFSCNSFDNPNNEIYLMGQKGINWDASEYFKTLMIGVSPLAGELLEIQPMPIDVLTEFIEILTKTVLSRVGDTNKRPDMIHMFLEFQRENSEDINLIDYVSQVFLFFMAGFHSVTTFLSFALYELALHRDIQKRLRAEVERYFDNLTFETLKDMKYLDMVVSEVLRKWPPKTFAKKEVSKTFTINGGEKPLTLEKGSVCSFPIFAIQNDPKYFPNPEKFDPERFNKDRINPNIFMPFGCGPSDCLGANFTLLETKIFLCYVVQHFLIYVSYKTPFPIVLDKMATGLAPAGGMWIGLQKLHQN